MSNLEQRTGGGGGGQIPRHAAGQINIAVGIHHGGRSPWALSLSNGAGQTAFGLCDAAGVPGNARGDRRCHAFNLTNRYSSLGATFTIRLREKSLTGCAPTVLMCWSSTWVGHPLTAGTPTWPRLVDPLLWVLCC